MGTLHSKYSGAEAQNILLLHVSSIYVSYTFGPTLNILLCKLNPSLISVDQLKKVCLLCRYVVKADAQQLSHSRSVLKHVAEKIPSCAGFKREDMETKVSVDGAYALFWDG